MAKAKTATESTETTSRAKAGSSIQAQCKALVLAVAREMREDGGILADTMDWLNRVAAEITDGQERGLPLPEKLAKLEDKRNEIFLRAGVVDGKFSFATPEDEAENGKLTTKIESIKRKIAKGETTDEDESETDETPESE